MDPLLEQILVDSLRLMRAAGVPLLWIVAICVGLAVLGAVAPGALRAIGAWFAAHAPEPQAPSGDLPQPDVAGNPPADARWAENVTQNDRPQQPDEIGGG